jgi:hypothetical protein
VKLPKELLKAESVGTEYTFYSLEEIENLKVEVIFSFLFVLYFAANNET